MVGLHALLTRPRRQAASLCELAPWFGMPDESLVLCQDGSLLAGYELPGLPLEGVDDAVLNAQIELMQRALRAMGERHVLWSVLERRRADASAPAEFANSMAARIDEAWRAESNQRQSATLTHQLFLGFRPAGSADAFFEAMKAELEQSGGNLFTALHAVTRRHLSLRGTVAQLRGRLDAMATEFSRSLSAFEAVTGPHLGLSRLRGENFLGALYARLNLGSRPGPVRVPQPPAYLAQALSADSLNRQLDQLEFTGPHASRSVVVLSTTGMPARNCSAQIDPLLSLDCDFALCQMFEFLDRELAQRAIQSAEQYYRMEIKSLGTRIAEKITQRDLDKVNTGNQRLADDAQAALAELTAEDIGSGYYAMTLLAGADSAQQAQRAADLLGGALRAQGYALTREVNGIMPAFLGTLPGNSRACLRKCLASTANLADLLPLRTLQRGQPEHSLFSEVLGRRVPCLVRFPTADGIGYDFSPHVQDLGHTLIVGGTGAGKTSLMHLIAAQFQKYFPCSTFLFDKDYSMSVLTVLLGGQHVDLATRQGRPVAMNPVGRMLVNDDVPALRRWLEVLVTAGSGESGLSAPENEELHAAVQDLRALSPGFWRLGHLYTLVRGRNLDLARKLAPYVDRSDAADDLSLRGPFADFFDNETDAFELGQIVGMETGQLLRTPQVASPFMDYAFYCIERRLDGRTPAMVYVEEAWYMLGSPVFAARMDDWLRTFRKKKAFLVFATQALDEIASIKSLTAFIANVPTRIFLPSLNSSVAASQDLYRSLFSLNDAQLRLLAKAVPKRDYLIVKPDETRLVRAAMPDLITRINEAASRIDLRERALAMAAGGDAGWVSHYLKEVLHV
ncbi:MAG: type IV secretion system protein VirB4 [Burkholderiaceae bacterium]|nr:type IV secretion system protein VirB4 [Burkholderiaceae bacterium]